MSQSKIGSYNVNQGFQSLVRLQRPLSSWLLNHSLPQKRQYNRLLFIKVQAMVWAAESKLIMLRQTKVLYFYPVVIKRINKYLIVPDFYSVFDSKQLLAYSGSLYFMNHKHYDVTYKLKLTKRFLRDFWTHNSLKPENYDRNRFMW